jgi:hypothetical protein
MPLGNEPNRRPQPVTCVLLAASTSQEWQDRQLFIACGLRYACIAKNVNKAADLVKTQGKAAFSDFRKRRSRVQPDGASDRPGSAEGRFEALHGSGLTALVGREEELGDEQYRK